MILPNESATFSSCRFNFFRVFLIPNSRSYVREKMGTDPINGNNAFIFYSRNLRVVKILHHDFTGYEVYTKWFDDGKFLKPVFSTIREKHTITKSQLLLLLAGAVQTKIVIV